uniref:Secreted protein n=1 Tax=Panagrolaimus sp. JU765 TaxID=591449 RepID=A0AC34PYM0_9BILA
MYKYFLRFALIYCFLINEIDCSYCGPYSVPYSLEVTPSGGLILGCTRSSCLGISPSQDTALQYSSFNNNDGFVRADASPGEPSPLEGVNPICEPAFSSGACPLPTQWVGGIIPSAGLANGS